jgi:hypothetical protein
VLEIIVQIPTLEQEFNLLFTKLCLLPRR